MDKQNQQIESVNQRIKVNADQEIWVRDRIRDAIRMARAVQENKGVAANEYACNMALRGIIDGQAIEIIKCLGLKPAYINLPLEKKFFNPLNSPKNNSNIMSRMIKI